MSSEARGATLVPKMDVVGVAIGTVSPIRVTDALVVVIAVVIVVIVVVVVIIIVGVVVVIGMVSDTSDVVGTCCKCNQFLFKI